MCISCSQSCPVRVILLCDIESHFDSTISGIENLRCHHQPVPFGSSSNTEATGSTDICSY